MKIKIHLLLFAFIFISLSCSLRYRTFINASNKLEKNEYTWIQYDSILNSFYTIQNSNFKLHNKLKLSGSYVCKEYDDFLKKDDYRTFKFTDSCYCFKSYRFYEIPTNNVIFQTEGVIKRHTETNDDLVIEYLLNRDYHLYNILKYAKISDNGDTLTFYKSETVQLPTKSKKPERKEIYIYDPTLTSLPIIHK
jgi:hypothetical protein